MSDAEPEPEPEAEPEPAVAAGPPVPPWVPILTGAGLALAVISALALVGIVAQGFAVRQRLNAFDKLGVAFLQNLDDTPLGIMLILAIVLVALPAALNAVTDTRDDLRAQLTLVIVVLVAALVAVAAVAGVVTRLRLDDARGQAVTNATRFALLTFLVRNFGAAMIAVGAALGVMRLRSPRSVTPSP